MPARLARLAPLAFFLLAGCGGPPSVSGAVTLDGKPVENGLITFVPADGKSANVAVKIKDGRYSTRVPPGPVTVRVSWMQVKGQRKMIDAAESPLSPIYEESIPAKYNTQSELKADITAGNNTLNWDLKSDGGGSK